jgi:hypothetical protein
MPAFRLAVLSTAFFAGASVHAGDIEAEPIRYSKSQANDPVARLQARLESGTAMLDCDPSFGYLRSLLAELKVPESSQTLVFSKTSFQRQRIAPKTPRALYFSDDVYVGYCHRGDVLEITAVDPQLGAVFYTCDQMPRAKPRFRRQDDTCLICHASSQNQGFPGHVLRSLFVESDGLPILSAGSARIDHTSPLTQRWGGWYVTGTSGRQLHRGNLIVEDRRQQPEEIDNRAGVNTTDLSGRLTTAFYLTPHSDIVALMVLEHQAETHNRITRANFLTRQALHEEAEMNKVLGRPEAYRSESIDRRIQHACEPLVQFLLFSGEAVLTEPIRGTSSFTEQFPQRGPRDPHGRSLRDFDLETRLFRYPCSYLIYTEAFDGLPPPARDYVYRRLWDVLHATATAKEYAHLSAADRQAILEILRATKANLPDYWREPDAAASSP